MQKFFNAGKTHLATAIALKTCQEGRKVCFYTAASLANILLEKNNKGTLNNYLVTRKKVELIVIDEVGFVPLHKDAAELLFQVISDCYEQKALLLLPIWSPPSRILFWGQPPDC
ncbi:ATP-binding protein [Anaerotignum sp.]|uniref:ATP-binding protein n=1 Tax=Anaerotignum sp. TaxID=2039241 RepID=UPI003320D292